MLQQHHGMHHRAIGHRGVGFDQDGSLRIAAQKRGGARAHGGFGGRLVGILAEIHVETPAGVDGDDQRLVFCEEFRVDGLAPASGKSTLTPSLSSGAVIMKMTSSTSMTSMYGTTLISPISLRRRSGLGMSVRLGPDAPGRGDAESSRTLRRRCRTSVPGG